jgi:phosphatidylserine decarboxylase
MTMGTGPEGPAAADPRLPALASRPGIGEWLKTLPLYLLPQHLSSRLMYLATRARFRPWKDWQIRWFVARYAVDLGAAETAHAAAYPHFNAFFTRALRPEARPVAAQPRTVCSPVDGIASNAGEIAAGRLFQAKGRDYTLSELLACDPEWVPRFMAGRYITLYLAPRDYHRVHMPIAGRLKRAIYVPGRLFAVNPRTTRVVPRLYARNERLVSLFETEAGPMAIVMVGALFVGNLEVVFPIPRAGPGLRVMDYDRPGQTPVWLEKGAEMGRFNMGSTVIILFGPGGVSWTSGLLPQRTLRMGEPIGTWSPRCKQS